MMQTQEEALKTLEDGHGLISLEAANDILDVLQVKKAGSLPTLSWESARQAQTDHGFFPYEPGPGIGVPTLRLAYYVAGLLGVDTNNDLMGRGSQAREITQRIREKLTVKTTD